MWIDPTKAAVWNQLRQSDLKAVADRLSGATFAQAASLVGVSLGNGPLHLANLVWLALVSALHPAKNFAAVLRLVLTLVQDAPSWPTSPLAAQPQRRRRARHDPRGTDPYQVSEEAFVQARRKMPWAFWVALLLLLTDRFESEQGDRVRWKRFRLLALDGTTVTLPHWQRLTSYFGAASKGKGRTQTQARLVMLEMPLVRMPWRYELTPLADSERTVAARLLADLRRDDLLLMDRGFWSYALFTQIAAQGAAFAIRRIAQAKLTRIRRLGRDDELVRYRPSRYPKAAAALGAPREMILRVISYAVRGFRPSAVVTNLLDPQQVSREEWVRLAAVDEAGRVVEPGLYHRRWEIETTFRELKGTQQLEGNLRSRTPEGIRYEVAGHVLLYVLVRWLIVEAAEQAGQDDPLRLSFTEALSELSDMRQTLLHADAEHVRRVLLPRLLERIASHEVPLRPGRHYARPGDKKPKNKGQGRLQQPTKVA